jgi:glycosyltransferase involved in cell wall biosynthesis
LLALKNSGVAVTALTRPGYPWDRSDRYALPLENSTTFEGVTYLHRKTPTMNLPLDLFIEEAACAIADVARKRKAAAIHAASNYTNALPALIAARRLGIPFSYEMRGLWNLTRASKVPDYEHSENFQLQMDLEALVAKHSDKVFVISRALGAIMEKMGVEQHRIQVLPNCVNPSTIEKARQSAGNKLKSFTVGYAGSLVPYEGLDLLVEAMAVLRDRGVSVCARIIGEGPCREDLASLSVKRRVSSQIEFLGRIHPDVARARLMESHVVVLPRRADEVCNLIPPIKLVEAQAMNLRIVASDVTAMKIELESDSRARLFPAGSVAGLAESLEAEFRYFNEPNRPESGRTDAAPIRTWADYVPEILSVFAIPRAE